MKNVIIIVIESFRSDHLGCYGHHYDVSPNIDLLANDGILYEDCWAHANCTMPSLATLYTGLTPDGHGVLHHTLEDKHGEHEQFRLSGFDTIQSVLKDRGYATIGFDWLSGFLSDGFDKYYGILADYLPTDGCERVAGTVARWVDSELKTPFYWFIHFWDTHVPYQHWDYDAGRFEYAKTGIPYDTFVSSQAGGEAQEQRKRWFSGCDDAAEIMAWYDASIYRVDMAVGEIIKILDAFLLLDDTCIIITGDHGESLIEHDIFFNHFGVYGQTLRVPLIIWEKGLSPLVVKDRVSHTEVFDLATAGEVETGGDVISYDGVGDGWRSVVSDVHHYLYLEENGEVTEELYNIINDKEELLNLAPLMPAKCTELRSKIP